jgi:PDZ domain-containing protein
MMRRLYLFFGALAVLAAALIVPMPFIAIEPGVALPVAPRVRIGTTVHPINGQLLLTAVTLAEPSAAGLAVAWVDPSVDVVPRPAVIPAGVDEQQYLAAQHLLFQESGQVAAAVGVRAAGYPVTVGGSGAEVMGVVKGSPADGKLRVGDVITAVDGQPIRVASDLGRVTARARAGDVVTLTVESAGRPRDVRVTLGRVDQLGRVGLGVSVQTVHLDIQLPFPVEVNAQDLGGPSAGLMISLTVFDLTDPGDLARGRTIAGTGTIDIDGSVGPVGGVKEKVETARRQGATIFLVPADELDQARKGADSTIRLVPVKTFDEARQALLSS